MLTINDRIHIPEAEFHWSYARSGGPGGQNVNKVSSKAVLRWNVERSPSLPEEVKARLRAWQRLTLEGELVISSQRYRDQPRNRQDCLDKLGDLLRRAASRPRQRKPTRITRASKEARLAQKRRRAVAKERRRRPSEE